MLTKILGKIDRFYLILAVVLVVLVGLVIITIQGIISATSLSNEIDEEALVEYGVDQAKLDESLRIVSEREIEPLDLGN